MNNQGWFIKFLIIISSCRNTCSIKVSPLTRSFRILFLILVSLCLSTIVLAQTQLGADIDGEAAYDASGYSASLSSNGDRLAIGAPGNDGSGINSGHVRVYQWSGTAWVQLGADIDGEVYEDSSGSSVSLSSNGGRLAIGAPGNDESGINSGHVRVYQWSGTAWVQLGADIDGEVYEDSSGSSVSLSSNGDRLAIGAPGNDGSGINSGHVRVYQWSGTAWVQLGADIDGEAAYDESGRFVSLSSNGNRLAIGAAQNSGDESWSGHVRVYQWSDETWTQLGADIDGEAAQDHSGDAVSLSSDGNRLAIGASMNDESGLEAGHVRVYQWSGTAWVQLGADIDGEVYEDSSGSSVSLSSNGNRLAIGAPGNDGSGINSGHVRVYQWSGTAWVQLGADIDGKMYEDSSGSSVSLSSNGGRLAIGAPGNDGNGFDSGHVRIYDLSMFNKIRINAGLNDAWYYKPTDGQGFFITIFPDLNKVSLAWFTYDTELPPTDAAANLGDPGHRWITAIGPIDSNQSVMNIDITSNGIFDTTTEIEHTDPPGSDGSIILTFDSCNSATIVYDITSINRQGIIPIRRVADDNIVICEALNAD